MSLHLVEWSVLLLMLLLFEEIFKILISPPKQIELELNGDVKRAIPTPDGCGATALLRVERLLFAALTNGKLVVLQ
jgi:hypothetical protein